MSQTYIVSQYLRLQHLQRSVFYSVLAFFLKHVFILCSFYFLFYFLLGNTLNCNVYLKGVTKINLHFRTEKSVAGYHFYYQRIYFHLSLAFDLNDEIRFMLTLLFTHLSLSCATDCSGCNKKRGVWCLLSVHIYHHRHDWSHFPWVVGNHCSNRSRVFAMSASQIDPGPSSSASFTQRFHFTHRNCTGASLWTEDKRTEWVFIFIQEADMFCVESIWKQRTVVT